MKRNKRYRGRPPKYYTIRKTKGAFELRDTVTGVSRYIARFPTEDAAIEYIERWLPLILANASRPFRQPAHLCSV